MNLLPRQYPDWKAPSADGESVIWPSPSELLKNVRVNQQRLEAADSVRLQNIPLPEIRRRMREFIGHDGPEPILATGHQTELYHAGVWAKNALISAMAEKLGGQAFHIAVDTDAPKHLNVRWPGESIPLTDDPTLASVPWCGMLAPASASHVDQIITRLRGQSASWGFEPPLLDVLNSLRRLSFESLELPSSLTAAFHELDWNLGLRHHVMLASPIWSSNPFLVFVHDLLAHADAVSSHYNAALQAYRDASGILSHSRPMPDLLISDEAVEVPLWLDDLHSGKRTRPSVFRSDRGWILEQVGGAEFAFETGMDGWEAAARLRKWLVSTRHRISPRAVTLTMFFRLLMVDQFIHGIGGGRYDQVSDGFIAGHYDLEPPAFGVTTATLYFPTAIGRKRVCVPCVKQEGHCLKHDALGERKRQFVEQIASLPRRSAQRAAQFSEMHRELRQAASGSEMLRRWQEKMQQVIEQEKQETSLFDRELVYAIQPRERLVGIIERYAQAVARAGGPR